MPRWRTSLVYVGIRSQVLAFDRKTGTEVWRTPLPARYKGSATLVNVFCDGEGLFASCAGEIFAINPRTGEILWHDPLKGLGTGMAIFASELGGTSQASAVTAAEAAQQAARTAAAT